MLLGPRAKQSKTTTKKTTYDHSYPTTFVAIFIFWGSLQPHDVQGVIGVFDAIF